MGRQAAGAGWASASSGTARSVGRDVSGSRPRRGTCRIWLVKQLIGSFRPPAVGRLGLSCRGRVHGRPFALRSVYGGAFWPLIRSSSGRPEVLRRLVTSTGPSPGTGQPAARLETGGEFTLPIEQSRLFRNESTGYMVTKTRSPRGCRTTRPIASRDYFRVQVRPDRGSPGPRWREGAVVKKWT